jgi:hypothetical protein
MEEEEERPHRAAAGRVGGRQHAGVLGGSRSSGRCSGKAPAEVPHGRRHPAAEAWGGDQQFVLHAAPPAVMRGRAVPPTRAPLAQERARPWRQAEVDPGTASSVVTRRRGTGEASLPALGVLPKAGWPVHRS